MIVRELVTRISYKSDRQSFKRTESTFDKLKKAAAAYVGFLTVGKVTSGFRSMIDAASDLEEQTNALGVAFGNNVKDVVQWSKQYEKATGRSDIHLQRLSGTLGTYLTTALGSSKASAALATRLTQVGIGVASVENIADEASVLRDFRSALSGSAEVMDKFGVNLRAANLDNRAFAMGMGASFAKLTEQQKLLVRAATIIDELKDKEDDAIRTRESYANVTKNLGTQFTKLQAIMGQRLLPVATKTATALLHIVEAIQSDLTPALRALKGALKVATIAAAAFFAVNAKIIAHAIITKLATAVLFLHSSLLKFIAAQNAALVASLPMVAALAAIGVAAHDLWAVISGDGDPILIGWLDALGEKFSIIRKFQEGLYLITKLAVDAGKALGRFFTDGEEQLSPLGFGGRALAPANTRSQTNNNVTVAPQVTINAPAGAQVTEEGLAKYLTREFQNAQAATVGAP